MKSRRRIFHMHKANNANFEISLDRMTTKQLQAEITTIILETIMLLLITFSATVLLSI